MIKLPEYGVYSVPMMTDPFLIMMYLALKFRSSLASSANIMVPSMITFSKIGVD